MNTFRVAEAKAHLSELLERTEKGEEVVITRRGHAQGQNPRSQARSQNARLNLLSALN